MNYLNYKVKPSYILTILDSELKPSAAENIKRFIRMMFFDQNPNRPNCFENYILLTAFPKIYVGIDDNQLSWVVSLLIKYLCGVRPQGEERPVADCLLFNLEFVTLDKLRYRNHWIRIARRKMKID